MFFEPVPASIGEAAHIDGAGVFRTFWPMVLPTVIQQHILRTTDGAVKE